MNTAGQEDVDWNKLTEVATRLVKTRGMRGLHHVACALLTADRRLFRGLHISAEIGAFSLCAEAAAIGQTQLKNSAEIKRVVSVRRNFGEPDRYEIVPPCGLCRERIFQFGREAMVLINEESGPRPVPIRELLPHPFFRRRQTAGL